MTEDRLSLTMKDIQGPSFAPARAQFEPAARMSPSRPITPVRGAWEPVGGGLTRASTAPPSDPRPQGGRFTVTRLAALALLVTSLAAVGSSVARESVTTLSNGVPVVVEERPATETVSIRLLLAGGMLDAPEGRRGLAEMHARMLLRGTEWKSAADLARAAEELGGRLEAYAGLRAETIQTNVPAGNLEPAIHLVSEVLLHPRLNASDLEKEKGLLTGELATSRDDPSEDLDDTLYHTLFPSHPLARLARLTPAEAAAITIEDLRGYHTRRPGPGHIVLVVVGRCDAARVARIARECLGGLSAPPGTAAVDRDDGASAPGASFPPRGRPGDASDGSAFHAGLPADGAVSAAAPTTDGVNSGASGVSVARDRAPSDPTRAGAPPSGESPPRDTPPAGGRTGTLLALAPIAAPSPLGADVSQRVHRRTTQPEIVLALPTAGVSDDDAPAWTLLLHILGGFEERLYTEIREKRGYAYWVRLETVALPTAGEFGVRTGARKKNLGEIEGVIRSELARIRSDSPAADEMERARRYLTTAAARADATNDGRCASLARSIVDGRPLRTYEETVARLDAVTADQVRDLARRLLEGKHVAVLKLY